MQTKTKVISGAALVAGATVFGMILAGSLDFGKKASADKEPAATPATAAAPARPQPSVLLPSFADIAEQVMPGVVSVTSTDIIKADKRKKSYHGGEGSPFDFFFGPDRRRGGVEEDEDQQEKSGGTGFVIEADGFIITNNHVIDGADKVEVKIGDKDTYAAKVVGRDPATDLALLKIEGNHPFATVRLGDSDRLRVGEWVMAIGDPLQFEKTVTVGVVSGKGRNPRISDATASFESLIQTDAAINFGNSGGPLVNISGEVIGINTAISRMAQNIGFAVPVNTVKRLLPQLKKGKVVRGYLGVNIQPISKQLQEAFELKSADGVLVDSVQKGKPGDKAGLKHDDVIIRVDDQAVKTNRDLIDYVSSKAPGAKVSITFIREGREKTVVATLEKREEDGDAGEGEDESEPGPTKDEKIGIRKSDLTPSMRRTYSIDRQAERGVVITHVKPVSAAGDAGLAEGDVILEVNGTEVKSVEDYDSEMKKLTKARYVRFYVLRSAGRPKAVTFIAAVKLGE